MERYTTPLGNANGMSTPSRLASKDLKMALHFSDTLNKEDSLSFQRCRPIAQVLGHVSKSGRQP
jgi:hypothetical protein